MDGTYKYINLLTAGGSGGSVDYMEVPYEDTNEVSIEHGWSRFPDVTVLDQDLDEIEADIDNIDFNQVIIRFDQNRSGKIILK